LELENGHGLFGYLLLLISNRMREEASKVISTVSSRVVDVEMLLMWCTLSMLSVLQVLCAASGAVEATRLSPSNASTSL
jgi:hypothetical protein